MTHRDGSKFGAITYRIRGKDVALYVANLVVHHTNERMVGDRKIVEKYRVPNVITSKSIPGDVVKRIHDYRGIAMSEFSTRRHAEMASQVGVDAFIALTSGAGGHTGGISPFPLMNEITEVWERPTVLAAEIKGADFAYIGTRFIS